MSSPKQNKSGIINLLASSSGNNPKFVPPVLREVGKLAAGVAAVSTTTGSATGNPRNKCALQPGHSLMDWIRLGNSGKDLTGVGTQAGHLSVTPAELSKHDKITDAWLAIRGKVFNITFYLPFHPGGPEELMKGAGKDATTLFEQIHSWVNYESILQKCLIGRLVNPTLIPEDLFAENSPTKIAENSPTKHAENSDRLPKFDWIQKSKEISVVFYTPPLENPLIELRKIDGNSRFVFAYRERIFINDLTFANATEWPYKCAKINYETGKIEVIFAKIDAEIWTNYGVLKQQFRNSCDFSVKISCVITRKIQVASDIFLLELERSDGVFTMVPIGFHVRVSIGLNDELSRSYTPIPSSLLTQFSPQKSTTDKLYLMIKRYRDGNLSKSICDRSIGENLYVTQPIFSGFKLEKLEKKDIFLLLAAGTGITPMLSIILFLLERRMRKSQSIRLIFCNKKLEQIPFKEQLEKLSTIDGRFQVDFLLSEPEANYKGKCGHITKEIIKETIDEQLKISNIPKFDLCTFVCGPIVFNELCVNFMKNLDIKNEQINVFQG